VSLWGHHTRGLDGFDPNFEIQGLEHALKTIASVKQKELANTLWQLLKRYRQTIYGVVESSTNQNFTSNRRTTEQASKAGKLVRERAWLPDRNGEFQVPSNIRLSDLPDDFDTESSAAKELAIKLGCRPEIDLSQFAAEERKKIELALTITPAEIEMIMRKRDEERGTAFEEDETPEGGFSFQQGFWEAFHRPQTRESESSPISITPVSNPEERRVRTQREIENAIRTEPSLRQRFHRVPSKKWETKNYEVRVFLREQYQGQCQICGHTFLKRDGNPYFEGLYLVSSARAAWVDRPGNVLCLCANCCAKLLHGQVEIEGDIVEQPQSFGTYNEGGNDKAVIKLKLCGESVGLTFSERHIIDLQEMLKADEPAKSQEPSLHSTHHPPNVSTCPPGQVLCTKCGNTILSTKNFCTNCGTKLK